MENTAKRYGAALCFTPMALFTAWTIYFFSTVQEQVVTSSFADHFKWVGAMIENYTSLWISLAIVCTITASILVYLVVHIARLKRMPAGDKVLWISLLPALGSVAFIAFWYFELRHEPDHVDVYPSIA